MPDFTLLGVAIHEFNNSDLVRAIEAERALREQDDWLLEAVSITRFTDEGVDVESLASIRWSDLTRRNTVTGVSNNLPVPRLVSPDVLKSLSVSPDNLSAHDLFEQVMFWSIDC